MDPQKITEFLRATINPNPQQRKDAEDQLEQIHKIIGFVPTILQIVMQNNIELPVRQAGAVYLKNRIVNSWSDHEVKPGEPLPFSIHEQDRAMFRSAIVDAIVLAPELIRTQLCICVNHIIKSDFPGRWPQVVDNISIYLQNSNVSGWNGALITLYQLVKTYEYKRAEERTPLNEAMNLLLPLIYQRMINLLNEQSEESVLLQKQILKIYYALTQYSLPLELISKEMFSQWMEVCRQIAERTVPDCTHLDDEEKPQFPHWKLKKWALHIMVRMFERYGTPRNASGDKYQKFAEWYLPTFSSGVLDVLLKILDQYRNGIFISPRVLTDILSYLRNAVSQAYTWKLIKPHMVAIIRDVIFPIMSFQDSDQELFENDPYEYIRLKFDIFEDYATPVPAAESLLHTCCKKRKGILPKAMDIIMLVLTSPNADNKQKDGALHMIGTLADILLKKSTYREQSESMLVTYVFPEFENSAGHMRARACWVLHYFSDIPVKNPSVLAQIMHLTTNALLHDEELPVKVEAAIALQMYLASQEEASKYVESNIKEITIALLTIIRQTENEDVTNVLQKIVCTFTEQVVPIASDICQHLATTFSKVLENEEGSDEKAITAMGLLNTIETLLTVMEDRPDVMMRLHPTVISVVGHIFHQNMTDFYEETFTIVYDLTSKSVSNEMWQMLELIYQVFKKPDGTNYFLDIMPSLYNYITVDTPAFLSVPNRLLAILDMSKTVLFSSAGEDPECHAAKLLEVIILQCKARIDTVIPTIVEISLSRLTRGVQSTELRTMCLQVVIAALYYNPQLLLTILENMSQPNNEPISSHFIKQWLQDTDCFLGIHDRKICVLGLCTLISVGEVKPLVLNEVAGKIIPALILLFGGLKEAYETRAQDEESDDEYEDDDDCEDALSSDEDEMDDMAPNYLRNMGDYVKAKAKDSDFEIQTEVKNDESDYDEDESDGDINETALESFTTPIDDEEPETTIDEYWFFKEIFSALSNREPNWYTQLISGLTIEQTNALQEILTTADQRKAARESKIIEKRGGFPFTQQALPTSFKFGS